MSSATRPRRSACFTSCRSCRWRGPKATSPAASARGIESGSPADTQLQGWLATRPSDTLFAATLRAIGAMFASRPDSERAAGEKDLLSYLTSIASASGGVLGFGAVSDQERAVLERVAAEIEKAHGAAGVLPKAGGDPPRA